MTFILIRNGKNSSFYLKKFRESKEYDMDDKTLIKDVILPDIRNKT